MTIYQRRNTATIEALQFTPQIGDDLRKGSEFPGLVHSEQGGYSYHGAPISYGDYMVGLMVMARDDFEEQYEPVRGMREPEPIAQHVETLMAKRAADEGTTGSVAVDTVLAQKAKAARTRKQDGDE